MEMNANEPLMKCPREKRGRQRKCYLLSKVFEVWQTL